jgi:hypothetical protein
MGRARQNIVYQYYEELGNNKFRCKVVHCSQIIKCNDSPTNLAKHLVIHKDESTEYLNRRKEIEENGKDEREQEEKRRLVAQPKITEHLFGRNRTQLGATHPRQKQFMRNLVGCAAKSSQSINFYTCPDLPDRPAPFRKLVEHLDSTIRVPSKRTLTRCMLDAAGEYKQKVFESASQV